MASEITMPKLSDTMTEGRFGSWRKNIGDRVERGEVVAEIETDKAVMELEAFASGILLEQRAVAGDVLAVGTVIGLIGAPGEVTSAPTAEASPLIPSGLGPERIRDAEPAVPVAPPQPGAAHTEQAAPVVRRRARELGIDLSLVPGSGPGGRILPEDLERFSGVSFGAQVPVEPEPVPAAAARNLTPEENVSSRIHQGALPSRETVPHSRMRSAIIKTVDEAWRTIPHFYLTVEVAMDAAEEVRRELRLTGSISPNDLVIKAAAQALGKYPLANASFTEEGTVMHREVNIGIAVALPDGLLVPVLKGCEGLSLKEIAARTPALVARARNGQLSATELLGATFTISNLGMYGVNAFAAVIHPGQAAILAVGTLRECVVARGGTPAIGKVMSLSLSADHRLLDGAYAAQFLGEIKTILETPVRLLI